MVNGTTLGEEPMATEIPGTGTIMAVFTAIVGIAMVAIIVSNRAQTAAVLQALGASGSQLLNAALSPVSSQGQGNIYGR